VSCCRGVEEVFDAREAARRLRAYRRRGPARSTRVLLDALLAGGVTDNTLLDVGGGVGAVHHALLRAGARSALDIDASPAYLDAAREESARQGLAGRARYQRGNFVELAGATEPADIVVLDRVICCYHDMPALVGASAAKALRLYALVYPRDTWWIRLGVRLINRACALRGSAFRSFCHPTAAVEAVVRGAGLSPSFRREVGVWQVAVYQRQRAEG
jgi:magnesium-protoporphyrin O-methyltransferase